MFMRMNSVAWSCGYEAGRRFRYVDLPKESDFDSWLHGFRFGCVDAGESYKDRLAHYMVGMTTILIALMLSFKD